MSSAFADPHRPTANPLPPANSISPAESSPAANAYDEVPYCNRAFTDAHVRRLEASAVLFGMSPAPVAAARVLELGCAAGHNLMPQAEDYPNAEFVGVDYSQRQVADGRAVVARLGLPNIDLRHASITDIDPSWGTFDYIICHGVYSWVPEPVRQKILEVCRDHLRPQGVAFISYNTYPGWHFRGIVRDMMKYHVAPLQSPREKTAQCRHLLQFLTELAPNETSYGRVLRDEVALVSQGDDSYLYHEHLAEHNNPYYFHEFMSAATACSLQFLSEANIPAMLPFGLPQAALDRFQSLPLLVQQQYLDFVRNRQFRETLLCHEGLPLERNLQPPVMQRFEFRLMQPPAPRDFDAAAKEPLTLEFGRVKLTLVAPLAKAAVRVLAEAAPRSLAPRQMLQSAAQLLPVGVRPEGEGLARAQLDLEATLLLMLCHAIVDFQASSPLVASRVADRPQASRVARWQATEQELVTNGLHETVWVAPVCRFILARLDGAHGRSALAGQVAQAVKAGQLVIPGRADGMPVRSLTPDQAAQATSDALEILRARGLLVQRS